MACPITPSVRPEASEGSDVIVPADVPDVVPVVDGVSSPVEMGKVPPSPLPLPMPV